MGNVKSRGHKEKSGHGSITKAGKVRGQTPKLPRSERRSLSPRQKHKRAYHLLQLDRRGHFKGMRT